MDVFVNGLVYHPTGNSMGTIVMINQLVQRFSVKPLGAVTKPCLIGYKGVLALCFLYFGLSNPRNYRDYRNPQARLRLNEINIMVG